MKQLKKETFTEDEAKTYSCLTLIVLFIMIIMILLNGFYKMGII